MVGSNRLLILKTLAGAGQTHGFGIPGFIDRTRAE
jgi:hypothetical protein